MTPNNLLYCESCQHYTRHIFVVNTGVCNVCIGQNKKPDPKFSVSKLFVVLRKFCYGIFARQGLFYGNQGTRP